MAHDDPYRPFRLNGGRFYQQPRRIKRGDREYVYSYWYCRSGWGKVSHLGGELPAAVKEAREAQLAAAGALAALDRIAGLLRRFVAGDALNSGERAALADLGFTFGDDVAALTQRTRPELGGRGAEGWERTREIAEAVLSEDERAVLTRLGLWRFVRRPDASAAQTPAVCVTSNAGRHTNDQ